MRSFWSDPYLWVHLAGIAALPIFLELCLVGLAVGEPLLPVWLELLFVGGVGILPILWMQWQRPFSIFSLPFIALKPTRLTDDQRRILHRFKSPINRGLAVGVAVLMAWVLWQLYQIAPLASPTPYFSGNPRGVGLLIAAIAFLGCNLFVQIPVSVLAVLGTTEAQFVTTEPYAVGQISKDFTLPGIRVLHLLPPLISEPKPPIAANRTQQTPTRSEVTAVDTTEIGTVSAGFEEEAMPEAGERSISHPAIALDGDSRLDAVEEFSTEAEFEFGSEPELETQEMIQEVTPEETVPHLDEASSVTETIEITPPIEQVAEFERNGAEETLTDLTTAADGETGLEETNLEQDPELDEAIDSWTETQAEGLVAEPDTTTDRPDIEIVEDDSITETWMDASQEISDTRELDP